MMTSREGLNSMSCTCTPQFRQGPCLRGFPLRGLAFAMGNNHVSDAFLLFRIEDAMQRAQKTLERTWMQSM